MTPMQKLRWAMLVQADTPLPDPVTPDDIEWEWTLLCSRGEQRDYVDEMRRGEVKTGLQCPFNRIYEADAVAAQMPDGSWVGWTYWHGGGKHGEPAAIPWMGDAYDLDCAEEEKVVTVRTFTRSTQ